MLAVAVSLALILNAGIAAAATRPGKGAEAPKAMGAKKASKIQANAQAAAMSVAKNTPSPSEQATALRARAEYEAWKARPMRPDEMIIKYKTGATQAQINAVRGEVKATPIRKFKNGAELVKLPKGSNVLSAASNMVRAGKVQYAEPNYLVKKSELIPNDDFFPLMWGLKNVGQQVPPPSATYPGGPVGVAGIDIKATQAWEITQGNPDLVVGVIDTGIDFRHPDLAGHEWVNAGEICGNGVDDEGNGYIDDCNGFDFTPNWDGSVYDPGDGDTHGTHVAGTIAASMNNGGSVGVAPNVKVAALKFIGPDGWGDYGAAIAAIEYARDKGIKILNNSWGGWGYSQALYDAMAASSDTLFVVAAGNGDVNQHGIDMDDNDPSTPEEYPAAFDLPNILSVAAVDSQGNLADFSNYGRTKVDVAAPGVDIISTYPMAHNASAAIFNDTGLYKSAVWGFGLEDLSAADAANAVGRVLNFFGAASDTPIQVILDDDFTNPFDPNHETYPSMQPYFEAALAGHPNVTYAQVSYNGSAPTLDPAKIVFWTTGRSIGMSTSARTLTPADLSNISNFLNAGGKLFLSGQDAIWNNDNEYVVTNELGVQFVTEGDPRTHLGGVTGTAYDGAGYTLTPWNTNYWSDTLDATVGVPTAHKVLMWEPNDTSVWYAWGTGTSMASPHVAGIAALVKSVNPSMNAVQIKDRIMNTATPLPSLLNRTVTGGMADAFRAVSWSPDNDVPGVPYAQWGKLIQETLDGQTLSDLDDVYRVHLRAGEKLKVWLQGAPGTDFDLYLFSPATPTVNDVAYVVAASEQWGDIEEFIEYQAPTEGDYYIDAFGYQGYGMYTLRAQWGNGPGIYQEDNPALVFGTGWQPMNDFGSYKLSIAGGASMEFKFYGDTVSVFALKNQNMGMATFIVDGVPFDADLYAPFPMPGMPVFTKGGLALGSEHTLVVRNKGVRSPQGKKTAIGVNVDWIQVDVDHMPPPMVSWLETWPYSNSVELEWEYDLNMVPDFDHWVVQRAVDGGPFMPLSDLAPAAAKIASSMKPKIQFAPKKSEVPIGPSLWYWMDMTATAGHDYMYQIAVVDRGGNRSPWTMAYSSAHPDPAPAPVANLQAKNGDGQVTLTWTPNTEPDVIYYNIYRKGPGQTRGYYVGWLPQPPVGVTEVMWIDFNVTNEESYEYVVYAEDMWRVYSEGYTPVTGHPSAAPAPVFDLAGTMSGNTVTLTWTPVQEPGVTYKFFRNDGMGDFFKFTAATSPATDVVPDASKTYNYMIFSVDEWGVPMPGANIMVEPPLIPPAPTGVTATPGDRQVTVSWSPVPGVDGYTVYRYQTGVEPVLLTPIPVNGTTYVDTAVFNGTTYSYDVCSVKNSIEGAHSAMASAIPQDTVQPDAPTNLQVTGLINGVSLSWTPSAAFDLSVYRISRDGGWVGYTLPGVTSYTDYPAMNGTTYTYAVAAEDDDDLYSPLSNSVTARPHDGVAPQPAHQLTDTVGATSVTLNWNASLSNDVTNYEVWQKSSWTGTETLVTTVGNVNTYTVNGLTAGSTYYFAVKAKDFTGQLSPVPYWVEATPGTGAVAPGTYAGTNGRIALTGTWTTWDDPNAYRLAYRGTVYQTATAGLTFDGTEVVWYGYKSTNGGNVEVKIDGVVKTTVDLNGTGTAPVELYRSATLPLGNHTLLLTYSGGVPTSRGLTVDKFVVTKDTTAPAAPTNLTATAGNGQVSLSWTAVNVGDLAGYNVYRGATQVNAIPLTGTTYTDTGLVNGTAYSYTVKAVDLAGNVSPASNTATATPSAPPVGDTTPPTVPVGLAASAGDTVVNLSWVASTDNSGVAPTYRVYWGTGSVEPSTWTEVPVTGTTWSHTGLTNGTTYWYKVVARDGAGNVSGESLKVWAMPQATSQPAGTHENNGGTIVYTGTWSLTSSSVHSGGSSSYSWSAGASATLTFTGTAVRWIAYTSPYYGLVDVYIDGVKVQTIDQYTATAQYKRTIFTSTTLTQGVHTIKVVRTGTKNPAAGDANISLDAYIVDP